MGGFTDDIPARPDRSFDQNLEYFKLIADHFRQDLSLFWNRANFYLLAHAGLFSAFVVSYPSLNNSEPAVLAAIPVLGVTVSIFWYVVLRGSLFWIDNWRNEMKRLDREINCGERECREKKDGKKKLDETNCGGCYCKIEELVQTKKYYSPSRVTGYLPLLFLAIWVAMLLRLAL